MEPKRILLLPALMLWSGSLLATGLEEGISAFHDGEYQQAFSIMEPLARAGDGQAQFYVGGMLVNGLGVETNADKGRHWLEQAIENKNRDAAITLGKMYLSGSGVPFDTDKGAHYLTLADSLATGADDDECD